MAEDYQKQMVALQERERELTKKMSLAHRAGANAGIIGQFQYMLDECRASQFELKEVGKESGENDSFNGFISIG